MRALDGLSFSSPPGAVFGLLGPERRRQVDDRQDPHHAVPPRLGTRPGGRPRRRSRARATCGARSASSAQQSGVDRERDRPREPAPPGPHLRARRRASCDARVDELLERFGLADAADRLARGYSGGMQRRLDVAIGLVHRPRVLFLDEPTTGLDPEVRAAHVGGDRRGSRARRA